MTNPEHGTYYNKRTIEQLLEYGLILIDKPPGPTSHEVVAWAKRILEIPKAGHSGTLDPQVSGVLPLGCLLYTSPSPRDLSTSRMPSSA